MSGRLLSRAVAASRPEFVLGDSAQIGSKPGIEVELSAPGVAGVHATIVRESDNVWLVDATHSQSLGVFLNGRRVQRERLQNLDVITIAGIDLVFLEQ